MDDRLRELMQDLGNAIKESLSDSDRIAEAIDEIKEAGYDVFLVLEATIGFSKYDQDIQSGDKSAEEIKRQGPTQETGVDKLSFTLQDQKFLKALKINPDKEGT